MMTPANNYDMGFDIFEDLGTHDEGSNAGPDFLDYLPDNALRVGHRLLSRLDLFNDTTTGRAHAADITERATEVLEGMQSPFFMSLHYMDVHAPYTPPKPYLSDIGAQELSVEEMDRVNSELLSNKDNVRGDPTAIDEETLELGRQLYDASIKYVDANIKRVVDVLRSLNLLQETLVVITADHGEEFGEHGGFFHGQKLYEELIRVPLIFSNPKLDNLKSDQQVSLLDLAPTICDIFSFDVPSTFQGSSFAGAFEDQDHGSPFTFAESTVKRMGKDIGRTVSCRSCDGRKVIYNEVSTDWTDSQFEFYDLHEDPKETTNRLEENGNSVRAAELQDRIRSLVEDSSIEMNDRPDVDDRLRSLGYLE